MESLSSQGPTGSAAVEPVIDGTRYPSTRSAARGWLAWGAPTLLAAALSFFYLALDPSNTDLAAQTFRVDLFQDQGFSIWNNLWFGGHHIPAYSVLFPPFAALAGAKVVAVASTLVATAAFTPVLRREYGQAGMIAALWFGAGASISLFTGRFTFAFGVAIAVLAVLAASRDKRGVAIALAALCPLASPVSALFLAGAVIVYAAAERRREPLILAAAALTVALFLVFAFPEGGTQPFTFKSFRLAFIAAAAVFVASPRDAKTVRYLVGGYLVMLVGSHYVGNPLGSNAMRMGSLLLGPAAVIALWPANRWRLLLILPLLLYWQWSTVLKDVTKLEGQASNSAAFYAPLHNYLLPRTEASPSRVEVLPVQSHGESTYIARDIYISRGWERQLDRKLNGLFYAGSLDAADYRKWLDSLAVGWVAVPKAPLDSGGWLEARLLRKHVPPYLKLVHTDRHWRVYKVAHASTFAYGAGVMTKINPTGFDLQAWGTEPIDVKIHFTPYWKLTSGSGCVEQGPGGFTRVLADKPGPIKIRADFSPWRIFEHGPRCERNS